MKHFIVYDQESGVVLRSGICQDEDVAKQARSGEAVMEATANAIVVAEVNLDPVRDALHRKIDADAEVFCLRFVTPGTTQAMRYQQKLAEAKAYQEAIGAGYPAAYPFLAAEATATSTAIADLVTAVLTQAAAWLAIGAAVEGLRLGAKKAVTEAANVKAMHEAAQVDWAQAIPA